MHMELYLQYLIKSKIYFLRNLISTSQISASEHFTSVTLLYARRQRVQFTLQASLTPYLLKYLIPLYIWFGGQCQKSSDEFNSVSHILNHSLLNILSFRRLHKNAETEIPTNILLFLLFVYGCEPWNITLEKCIQGA